MNFILYQEEKVKKLEEYMSIIGNDFMQLSLEVIAKLKEEIKVEENRVKKIEKITRYPDTEDLEPPSDCKFTGTLTKKAPLILPKSSCQNFKSHHDAENSLTRQSTPHSCLTFGDDTTINSEILSHYPFTINKSNRVFDSEGKVVQWLETVSHPFVPASELTKDGVRTLATASGSNRLKEALEDLAGRRRQDYNATPSHPFFLFKASQQALIPLVDPNSMDLEFLSLCKV
ncbi:hypothetical protein Tco_0507582 [Tanacetum coccineum]